MLPPPAPVAASHSWYLGDLDPTRLRALGASDEKAAVAVGLHKGLVVLDAGDPSAVPGGTRLPDGRGPAGPAAITAAATAYATGWRAVVGSVPLTLVVATSNDGDVVNATQGGAWATLVDSVALAAPGVDVRGGFDAEPDYNDPGPTLAWVRGYLAAKGRPLVDIGDCACTPTQALPRGWTLHQRAQVALAGTVLPQQYRTSGIDAIRWAHLDASTGKHLQFLGVLTETRACEGPPPRACEGIDQSPATAEAGLSAALGRPVAVGSDIGYLVPPPPSVAAHHRIRDALLAVLAAAVLGAAALVVRRKALRPRR